MRKEHDIQKGCVTYFRLAYPQYRQLLFSVPNGAYVSPQQRKYLSTEGLVSGVADLILLVPRNGYGSLCIEMKTQKGRLQETQKEWQRAAETNGNKYVVCRSFDEFRQEVVSYLGESDCATVEDARRELISCISDKKAL